MRPRLHAVTGIALDMIPGWPAALTSRPTGAAISSSRLSPAMTQFLNASSHRPQKDFIAVDIRS